MCVNRKITDRDSTDGISEARPVSKQLTNICDNNKNKCADRVESRKVFVSDLLALSTQYTRKSFELMLDGARRLKETVGYKIVTRTTQPAHLASILLVLVISLCLWPELHNKREGQKPKSTLTLFVYLGSFAAHFGAQLWMTFVSGLALYFSLPRHTFGMCQEILFPKYFLLNTILSCSTFIAFAKINTNFDDLRWIFQLVILSVCIIIEMTIYFYLTPSLLTLMRAKYQFEQKLGNGQEVGYQETFAGFRCPRYQEIHRNFRRVHIKCAIGNVIAICCTFMHLYYLSSKIEIR